MGRPMPDTGENRVTGRDNKKRTCRKARNKRTEPFHTAAASLQGIEFAHMIRKKQFGQTVLSPFQQFASFAG
jgi:putative transposase